MDREIGLELADWLASMRKLSDSRAQFLRGRGHDTISVDQHSARLEAWEKMVREAVNVDPNNGM